MRNLLYILLVAAFSTAWAEERTSEACPGGGYAQQGHCPGLLSSPAYSGVTTSSVTCGVTYANTGPRGTVQVCVSESSEPPSAEHGTGFAACSGEMDSAAVEALGSLGVEISGLQPNTTYYCHVVAINPLAPTGNGRITNVVTSASFETLDGDRQTEFYFAAMGNDSTGDGSQEQPWLSVTKANSLDLSPGDSVLFRRGDTFTGHLQIDDDGTSPARITVGAYGTGDAPIIRRATFSGDWLLVEDITFDGNQDANRPVIATGDGFTLQNFAIRNATRNCLELNGADDFLVDSGEISLCLNGAWDSDPIQDAHGIVVSADQREITGKLSNLNIHEVSGDSIQANPNRPSETGFTINLTFEDSVCWTQPLEANFNAGWQAGHSPGENCIDTKADDDNSNTINLTVTNVTAYGFAQDEDAPPAMSNRAVFNLKEDITAVLNRITCYDSEICFRVRGDSGSGNADATIMNAVVYDADTAIRAETNVANLKVYNSTFGDGITMFLQNANGGIGSGSDLKNNVFVGTVPGDFSDASNVSASAEDFAGEHDYRPLDTATDLVDAGVDLLDPEGVTVDRDGAARSATPNIGAYETTVSTGDHAYFEMLRGNEHFLDSIAYRSQEEITPEIAAASNGGVYYDETVDAARFPNSSGSTSQLRHPYPGRPYNHAKGGTLLTYWEARWGAGYRYLDGARNGVNTHKAFQFSNEDNGTGNLGLFMEPRALYGRIESYVSNGGDPNAIAYVDIRAYGGLVTQTGGQQTPEGVNYGAESVSPIANHYRLKAEVWHSFWLFVDWDNNELSMWVAEAGEAPVLVYDRNTATFNTNLQRFVFEFNTSQDRSPQTPPINTWGRNVVSLRNPTFAEVAALVGQF